MGPVRLAMSLPTPAAVLARASDLRQYVFVIGGKQKVLQMANRLTAVQREVRAAPSCESSCAPFPRLFGRPPRPRSLLPPLPNPHRAVVRV